MDSTSPVKHTSMTSPPPPPPPSVLLPTSSDVGEQMIQPEAATLTVKPTVVAAPLEPPLPVLPSSNVSVGKKMSKKRGLSLEEKREKMLQMFYDSQDFYLVINIEFEEHKGQIAIGLLHVGELHRGMEVKVCTSEDECIIAKVSELFVYENFGRVLVESVKAGDICAVCGISDIMIGETIAVKISGQQLPAIKVEEPTAKMAFSINTSPFVGHEGKFVTSKNLRDRLYRELERNLAMKVEDVQWIPSLLVEGTHYISPY